MNILGKNLSFYARFSMEIDALYEVDEDIYEKFLPWLDGAARQELAEKVDLVWEAACLEMDALFHDPDGRPIRALNNFCDVQKIYKRNSFNPSWWLIPRQQSNPKTVSAGCYAHTENNKFVICPWIWVRGGRRKEEALRRIVGNNALAGKEVGWGPGNCILATISIEEYAGPDAGADAFLEKLSQPFNVLTAAQMEEIFHLAKN